ncbi:protein-tyrosine phosphatase-like protein [Chlamydoabsidia padenii]|nr:protein-tyrosine phosphatase-like protein [Chlamydoabsidia padenii]
MECIPGSAVASHFPTVAIENSTKHSSTILTPEEKELLPRQKFCVNFISTSFRRHFIMPACTLLMKLQLAIYLLLRQEQWATCLVSKRVLDPLGLPNLYKKFVEHCPDQLYTALMVFTEEQNYPIHVQCSFGKDRTGLVCFLVLAICGVPEELIVEDYAKTQEGLRPIYNEIMMDLERVGLSESFIDASPEIMRGLIEFINEQYGSVQDYLVNIVGITLEQQAKIRNILCVV